MTFKRGVGPIRFQAKLYLFFAVTVILPISLATAVAAVLYTHFSDAAAYDRLQQTVTMGEAAIASRTDVLGAALSASARNHPGLVSAAARHDGSMKTEMDAVARDAGASSVSLFDSSGALIGQTANAAVSGSCLASARIPLRLSGALAGYLEVDSPIDSNYLAGTLKSIGGEAAIYCGGQPAASDLPAPLGPLPAAAGNQGTNVTGKSTLDGSEYLTYQDTVPGAGSLSAITIVAASSDTEILSTRTHILEAGLSLIAFTMLIASLLGFLLTRSISRPLRALTATVLRVEAGDLDCVAEVGSADEVGILARNFNRMCGQLKQYIDRMHQSHRQLQQAFALAGDLLVSGYDLKKLAGSVNRTAALATGASATGFFIIDESGSVVPVDLAPEEFFDEAITSDIMERVAGSMAAMAAGGDLIAYPLRKDRLLLAPMCLHGRCFGILAAAVPAAGEASCMLGESGDAEVPVAASCDILGSLANQAATAMENVRLNQKLQQLVITDSLTGLYNVRYFNERLAVEMEQSRRKTQPLSLAILDLDNFKQVNDTYGHQTGDEVLRQIGRLLGGNLRKPDLAARYGGEEFVIVLPQTAKETAYAVVEKLRRKTAGMRIAGHPEIRISFSAGVAACPDDAGTEEALVRAADGAAYQAKEKGKNRTIAA